MDQPEVIVSISEVESVERERESSWSNHYDGFQIRTTKRNMFLLIASHQDCCESWGYFLSEDDTQRFIGGVVLDVSVTDTELKSYPAFQNDDDDRATMFVNVVTDVGTLQFVAYNAHNGYYGHRAIVEAGPLQHEEVL